MTERLYFIVEINVKSRENPEHKYWPDQSRALQEKNPYWLTSSSINRVVSLM